jgi:hypothetical protein
MLPVFDPSWKSACESCIHVRPMGEYGMRCAAVPLPTSSGKHQRGLIGKFCIDVREEGAACGPDAVLRVQQQAEGL